MNKFERSTGNDRVITLGHFLLAFVFALGFYTRAVEFLSNRSIWLDEASLALTVINRSFYEIVTQPPDYFQVVPIGFILLTKLLVSLFGKSEFVFRSIPLISSLTAFFVLYRLSLRCLPGKFAIIPLFLVATSSELLRYATEFKPYSSDVLLALCIAAYVFSSLDAPYTRQRGYVFGAIGAVVLWFSFPSVFVLGGAGAVLLYSFIAERRWQETKNLLISFACWGVSLTINYCLFLKTITGYASVEYYWNDSFAPLPPFTIEEQIWFIRSFMQIFYYSAVINQALIGCGLFIVGAYAFYKKQNKEFFVFILPLVLALMASALHKYPFEGRLLLFYVPFLYIFIARGISFLIHKRSYFAKVVGWIALIAVLCPAFAMAYAQVAHTKVYREEIRPALHYIKTHKQKDDIVYIYYGANRAFQYYADVYGLKNKDYIMGIGSREDWGRYRADLDQLKGEKRAWLLFTHVYRVDGESEERYMLDYLESFGKKIDVSRFPNVSVYLYDLTKP